MTAPGHGEAMTRGARRAVIVLFTILAVGFLANLAYTSTQVSHVTHVVREQDGQARRQAAVIAQLRAQLLASCAFADDLGTAPLPASPKPGKLGVKLVADSRQQWRQLRCPGTLPVPPGLARWAAFYHLPSS